MALFFSPALGFTEKFHFFVMFDGFAPSKSPRKKDTLKDLHLKFAIFARQEKVSNNVVSEGASSQLKEKEGEREREREREQLHFEPQGWKDKSSANPRALLTTPSCFTPKLSCAPCCTKSCVTSRD